MQVEATRKYRVRAIAKGLDVSVATIYRAVESGELRAIRVGTGKGAIRVPGDALLEYLKQRERAAVTRPDRTASLAQAEPTLAGDAA